MRRFKKAMSAGARLGKSILAGLMGKKRIECAYVKSDVTDPWQQRLQDVLFARSGVMEKWLKHRLMTIVFTFLSLKTDFSPISRNKDLPYFASKVQHGAPCAFLIPVSTQVWREGCEQGVMIGVSFKAFCRCCLWESSVIMRRPAWKRSRPSKHVVLAHVRGLRNGFLACFWLARLNSSRRSTPA